MTIYDDFEQLLENQDLNIRQFSNKSILITGATGMLASYLVKYLIYADKVLKLNMKFILAVRSREKAEKVYKRELQNQNIQLYLTDLRAPFDIKDSVNLIIHAASLADPQYYRTNPVDVVLPNVLGTYYCLELARQKKCENFLFFSSGDVYGALKDGEIAKEEHFGELDPMALRSCYGESKRMGESLCTAYYQQYCVPVKSIRIAHTYGPTVDYKKDQRVFGEFVKGVIEDNCIVMKSKGDAKRPFCYLMDFAAACVYILLYGKSGEAYNIANDKNFISIKKLAEEIIAAFPERNIELDMQLRKEDAVYMENKITKGINVSADKLRGLGWSPSISVREGFRRTIMILEENEQGEW